MFEPNNDVYEEVVKPLLEEVRPQVDLAMFTCDPLDSPFKKRLRVNLDYEYV
jgi:hypothetical protein